MVNESFYEVVESQLLGLLHQSETPEMVFAILLPGLEPMSLSAMLKELENRTEIGDTIVDFFHQKVVEHIKSSSLL